MKKEKYLQAIAIDHAASAIKEQANKQEEANEIASREQKTNAERLEFEKNTKDRVDISLKEYENLKESLKYYREQSDDFYKALIKIARPIIRNKELNEEVKRKIARGEFECEVRIINDFISRDIDVALIFHVPHYENRR